MRTPPTRSGLIAGGNWIVDHVKLIDSYPPQDALASISRESSSNGGSPYNLLKNLARMGVRYPLAGVGLVGDDDDGRRIFADCRSHGIDTRHLRAVTGAATSYTDVMTVQGTGRRTFFHQRGANARLEPSHFDFAGTSAKIFHLGYLLLLDSLDAIGADGRPRASDVLRAARAAGLRTSVDCVSENSDRFRSVALPLLRDVDYFFANDFEAERLTGIFLRRDNAVDPMAVSQAAHLLHKAGVREWVVIHSPEAVYACGAGGVGCWQPSLRVPPSEIAGAAGAGDAFAAGVLHGLHEGWPIAEGLRLGVCAAAASLAHPTCSEGVRSTAECLALGERFGFQPLPT